jgi:poly-gamma-glutamate synthesis protein (capsule biosynthesis protein)
MAAAPPITVAAIGDFIYFDRPRQEDIEATRRLLTDTDVVVANMDVVLSDRGTPVPKWANLRADPRIAGDLRKLGVDVAILANNHTMDYRAEAMAQCLAAYNAAGIVHSGAGANLAEATAPRVIETPNGTVAILSVCSTLSPESAAGEHSPGVAPLRVWQSYKIDESLLTEQPGSPPEVHTWPDDGDLERTKRDVAAARKLADHVLVFTHWGVPSPWRVPAHPVLQESQRVIGHALIDAGAGAIIGNHAHELHGIEYYAGKPIIYCLGNFWIDGFQRFSWMGREGVVLRLLLRPDQPVELDLRPFFLDDRGLPQPDASARAVDVLTTQSREFGTTFAADNGRFRVVAPS